MSNLEIVGVFFCVILGAVVTWLILYILIGDAEGDDTFRALTTSVLTIVVCIVLLTAIITSYIEAERKNDEYKKVISEYEGNKE